MPSTKNAQGVLVLDQAHYAAIGGVADAWATLEFRINMTIWELANVEQFVGACMTAQIIAIGGRTRALSALVSLRGGSETLIGKVNHFGATAEGAARERNRILHDPWVVGNVSLEPMQIRITADRKLDFGFKPVPVKDILLVRDKIAAAITECEKLTEKIFAELPTFSRTQFSQSAGIGLHPRSDQGSEN